MQIKLEQLSAQLKRGMLPVYLVTGDEPLLTQEACDAIRAAARAAGCSEREVHHVEGGFDWDAFVQSGDAMSLFAERKLIELRLRGGKPGEEGAKALAAYCARPSPDNVLLISAGKIERETRNAKWYKAVDEVGGIVTVWPLERRDLPGWAARRMQARGLAPTPEAVNLLVERVEGNLLACMQEIEKLLLWRGVGPVTAEDIISTVADSARYDIYGLTDAALEGDLARVARMIAGLRAEGEEPTLTLWALVRDIRLLATMAQALKQGQNLEAVFAAHKVWDKRKPPLRAGLNRHSPAAWRAMLRRAAQVDGVIKGARPGNAWDELLQLALWMGGRPPLESRRRA